MQKLHKHMIYMIAVSTLKKGGGGGGMANGVSKLLKQVSMYFYVRTKNFLFGTDYSVKLETTLIKHQRRFGQTTSAFMYYGERPVFSQRNIIALLPMHALRLPSDLIVERAPGAHTRVHSPGCHSFQKRAIQRICLHKKCQFRKEKTSTFVSRRFRFLSEVE